MLEQCSHREQCGHLLFLENKKILTLYSTLYNIELYTIKYKDKEQMIDAESYAKSLATQLRKGFLAYCVLKICSKNLNVEYPLRYSLTNSDDSEAC